jgi:hypothetical protein
VISPSRISVMPLRCSTLTLATLVHLTRLPVAPPMPWFRSSQLWPCVLRSFHGPGPRSGAPSLVLPSSRSGTQARIPLAWSHSDVRWYWALVERQHNLSWRTTDTNMTMPSPRPLNYLLVLPLAVSIRPLPCLHFRNNNRLLPRFLPAAAILVTGSGLPAHTAPLKNSTCRI